MEYLVTWDIEINADSPEEAARKALEIHRDPSSLATVFMIGDVEGKLWKVDLSAEPGERVIKFLGDAP